LALKTLLALILTHFNKFIL